MNREYYFLMWFEYVIKICILLLFIEMPLFGQVKSISVTGIATDSSGNRIPGVRVCTDSHNCVLTNTDGLYEIDVSQSLSTLSKPSIRFSRLGYAAAIKIISNNKVDVILQKSAKKSDNKRIVPRCSNNDNLVGWDLKIIIPSRSIIEIQDIDYLLTMVPSSKAKVEQYKHEQLRVMSGINVGSGIPENYLWPFLEEP
ncbi:MAG: carboxypeptidase-like regulatory domain-containing protein, partial [Acidobacteriota bacterium]|nr:carboxypeptidase-like regulatory domain-containing protein [Acidobacteriota bacterium]